MERGEREEEEATDRGRAQRRASHAKRGHRRHGGRQVDRVDHESERAHQSRAAQPAMGA